MKALFDNRMAVAAAEGSTPSLSKPLQLYELLSATQIPIDWVDVTPVEWEQLESIHDPRYLRVVQTGRPPEMIEEANVRWTPELAESLLWTVGSMVGAVECAAESACGVSLSSGFHHAHYARPGTFCLVNGLALAALEFLRLRATDPVLILDCDYHYGNGTDDILGRLVADRNVKIRHISMGRKFRRPGQAEEYMHEIDRIGKRIDAGAFCAVVYQAGMDVLRGDPLGGLLTYRQTYRRDLRVFEACKRSDTPIAWNLAGGYRRDADGSILPVLRGHLNTFSACARVYDGWEEMEPHLA